MKRPAGVGKEQGLRGIAHGFRGCRGQGRVTGHRGRATQTGRGRRPSARSGILWNHRCTEHHFRAMLGNGGGAQPQASGAASPRPVQSARCRDPGTRLGGQLPWGGRPSWTGEPGGLSGRTAHSPWGLFPAPNDPLVHGHQRGGPAGRWSVTRPAGEQVLGLVSRHGGSVGAPWVAGTCFM